MSSALPLSPAQMGIWLGQQLNPDNPVYWTAEFLELNGPLDFDALQRAVYETVLESDALHMRFVEQDEGVCQIPVPVPEPGRDAGCNDDYCHSVTFAEVDPADRWNTAIEWMQTQLRQPANLEQDRLWRCHLLQLSPEQHLLMFQAHHILLDGFGFALLLRRLAARYNALTECLSTDCISASTRDRPLHPFQAVLDAEKQYQESATFEQDRDFWIERLQSNPAPARIAPTAEVSHEVLRHRMTLPAARVKQWQQAAQRLQVDWFCWLNAGIALWLYEQTGRHQITLGIPVMNRLGSAALNVPCMHMNIVPLPVTLNPQATLRQLVQQIQRTWQSFRPHLRYRYEAMKQDLKLQPDQRLFGPVVNLMPFERPLQFGNTTALSHPLSAGPVEDLAFNILPQRDRCIISLEANPSVYSAEKLTQCGEQILTLLDSLAKPGHQPLGQRMDLSFRKRVTLVAAESNVQPMSVTQALLRHALACPRAAAVSTLSGQRLSYGQLLPAVQSLAGILVERGVEPGDRIALLLPRKNQTIVAMLACMWVGAYYVPLDPEGPQQRAERIIEHADPKLILVDNLLPADWWQHPWLTQRHPLDLDQISAEVPQPLPLLNPRPVSADSPAYLLYTSGSTGTPNGVVISRAALDHFCGAASQRYDIQSDDRILQFAPLHFDASVEEIFLALANGASLVLRDDSTLTSITAFLQQCAEHQISVLDLPTAFWHELVFAIAHNGLTMPACVRIVIIGGEAALPAQLSLWQRHVSPQVQLINTYGPTETTVVCTSARLNGPEVSIGTPLPGVQALVLDENLLPVLPGESGELCILGPTLANGYWQDAALTAQRFVHLDCLPDHPRAYRTGDRVTLQENGELNYQGRLDNELKISGQRISPTAIESVICTHPSVLECAVLALDTPSRSVLVAFLATADAQPIEQFKDWLEVRLLAAAVPAQRHWYSQLPRNANNKIDRKQLQQEWLRHFQQEQLDRDSTFSELETVIADIWHRLLGVAPRDNSANFFDLGGKSLQAIQVANRLSRHLQIPIAAATLFRHPQLGELASVLTAIQAEQTSMTTGVTDSHPETAQPPFLYPELAATVELQSGTGTPIFCIHPADGMSWCYIGLAQQLPNVPLIGIQSPGLLPSPELLETPESPNKQPDNWNDLIDLYLEHIRTAWPNGPYRLLGWSMGGGMAQVLATRLEQLGETVEHLFLLDAFPSDHWRGAPAPERRDAMLMMLDDIDQANDDQGQPRDEQQLLQILQAPGNSLAPYDSATLERMVDTTLYNMVQYRQATHPKYAGNVLFFRAAKRLPGQPDWPLWEAHIQGRIDIVNVDCSHFELHLQAPLTRVGQTIARHLSKQHQPEYDQSQNDHSQNEKKPEPVPS